jgi:hypothetical protein
MIGRRKVAAACVLVGGAVAALAAVVVLQSGDATGPTAVEEMRSKRLAAAAIDLATKDPARAAQLARDSYGPDRRQTARRWRGSTAPRSGRAGLERATSALAR